MHRRLIPLAPAVLAALLVLPACGSDSSSGGGATTAAGTSAGSSDGSAAPAAPAAGLTLLTYDAFTEPDALAQFTEDTGIAVKVAKSGDAGTLVNKAILTAGRPEGDVLWGVDNTLLSRAVDEDVFAPYESQPARPARARRGRPRARPRGHPGRHRRRLPELRQGLVRGQGAAPAADVRGPGRPGLQGPAGRPEPGDVVTRPGVPLATVAHFGDRRLRASSGPGSGPTTCRSSRTGTPPTTPSSPAGGGQGDRPDRGQLRLQPAGDDLLRRRAQADRRRRRRRSTPRASARSSSPGSCGGPSTRPRPSAWSTSSSGADFQAELPLSIFVYPVREDVALPAAVHGLRTAGRRPADARPGGHRRPPRRSGSTTWTQTVLR